MLNFKMLHRADSDNKAGDGANQTKELLHVGTEARITFHLKPTDFCLKVSRLVFRFFLIVKLFALGNFRENHEPSSCFLGW